MKIQGIPILLVVCWVIFTSCSQFTSHYSVIRHQNLTKLKALHVKLFEDWTEGSGKNWNKADISAYCDRGDLSFREAFEFAKSQDDNDKTGQNAVAILWSEFNENCGFLLSSLSLFSKPFKQETILEIEKNYDYAISGELSRLYSPE